jgi:hypothetical protein
VYGIVLALLLGATAAQPSTQAIKVGPGRRVEAVITYEVKAPQLRANEWVLVASRLPVLPGQDEVSSSLEPGGRSSVESSPFRRPILAARVPVRDASLQSGITIKVHYKARLFSRNLVANSEQADPAAVAPLAANVRRAALAEWGLIDFHSKEFQTWLDAQDLRRQKDESDLDFARRAFLHIKKHYSYDYQSKMDRRASFVCSAASADCGGLSVLFVSVLRANKIPARVLVGFWALSAKAGAKLNGVDYFQTHAKAEFFAEGIVWIPVDTSSAILQDKSKAGLRYFGHDKGDFIVFHLDPSMVVDSVHFGKKSIDWLQFPADWATGSGSFDGVIARRDWQVTTENH